MDSAAIRKGSLRAFLLFLILTALLAMATVLQGGNFGDLEFKALATSFTVSGASICAMSSAAFMERRRGRILGMLGILLAAAAAILLIGGLWSRNAGDPYWKATLTVIVLAVGFAHAFLLALPELDEEQEWIQKAIPVSIGFLAFLIILGVWKEITESGYLRLITAVAIFVGLETVAIPILVKLHKDEDGRKGSEGAEGTEAGGDSEPPSAS